RPLGISQNESVHPKLESQPSPDENPESQQTLAKQPVQGYVMEQSRVVAALSQLRTINVPASPRSNPIHATLFPECR
ncbi:hypothetical protein ABIB06_007499, partial [Bradyrhizobium sp. LB8.2]|uniref:hypothetical protein n=1 Tax=unclassified Bradyrhizobium TaxID=2631580 RepID=UPI0033914E05